MIQTILSFTSILLCTTIMFAQNNDSDTIEINFLEYEEIEDSIHYVYIKQGELLYDVDGNSYKTIRIGSQLWMAENLKTKKYNDTINIPFDITWENSIQNIPGYCWYENDEVTYKKYGALYNWYVVNTHKICPKGWHVPSVDEFKILSNTLSNENIKVISNIESENSDIEINNEISFTHYPCGFRSFKDNKFYMIDSWGHLWTINGYDEADNEDFAFYWQYSNTEPFDISENESWDYKYYGFSIRCLKD